MKKNKIGIIALFIFSITGNLLSVEAGKVVCKFKNNPTISNKKNLKLQAPSLEVGQIKITNIEPNLQDVKLKAKAIKSTGLVVSEGSTTLSGGKSITDYFGPVAGLAKGSHWISCKVNGQEVNCDDVIKIENCKNIGAYDYTNKSILKMWTQW